MIYPSKLRRWRGINKTVSQLPRLHLQNDSMRLQHLLPSSRYKISFNPSYSLCFLALIRNTEGKVEGRRITSWGTLILWLPLVYSCPEFFFPINLWATFQRDILQFLICCICLLRRRFSPRNRSSKWKERWGTPEKRGLRTGGSNSIPLVPSTSRKSFSPPT
jgi:hypothetical protein